MSRNRRTEPVRITTAPVSPGADLAGRQRRYLISMGIRVACFVGAIVVGPGILRWVLVAGAVILPYVAVVMANSASPQLPGADLEGPDAHALPGGSGTRREL